MLERERPGTLAQQKCQSFVIVCDFGLVLLEAVAASEAGVWKIRSLEAVLVAFASWEFVAFELAVQIDPWFQGSFVVPVASASVE